MAERRFRTGGGDRNREPEFDLVAAGRLYGLTPAEAYALWQQIDEERGGRHERRERFHELARRLADAGDRVRDAPAPGRLTRVVDADRDPRGSAPAPTAPRPSGAAGAPASRLASCRARAAHELLAAVERRPALTPEAAVPLWRAAERRAASLYRRTTGEGDAVSPYDPAVDRALAIRSGGSPLPSELRHEMERVLDLPLGRVRIHCDAIAAEAARALRAQAFTVGEDIFFAAGAFAPDSREGKKLLVHELSHVVQAWQGRAVAPGAERRVSTHDDALEREAEAVADRFDRRAPAPARHLDRARSQPTPGRAARAPREARALADAAAGPGFAVSAFAPGILSRRPDPSTAPLPDTAGGARLGRVLLTSDSWVPELRELLKANNLTGITDKAWKLLGNDRAPRMGDAYDNAIPRYPMRIENAVTDPARRAEILDRFYTDLAAVGAEQLLEGKLDIAKLTRDVDAIARTYERLAEMYRDDRLGTVHPTRSTNTEPFERRGSTLFELAKSKLSGDRRRSVMEALAADVDRLEQGEATAPISGGQALVQQLLGPDGKNLDGLRDAYIAVLSDVRGRAVDGRAAEVVRLTYEVHLEDLVLGPIRRTLTGKTGDALQQALRWLAREIGTYLAEVDAQNAIDRTLQHLRAFGQTFVVVYGGAPATGLPADITDQAVKSPVVRPPEPDDRATRGEVHRPPVQNVADACARYPGYDLADITAWLRSYFTDRKAYEAKRFSVHEIRCVRTPGATDGIPAGTEANLAEYRATATRILDALAKHVATARQRDAEIAKLRGGKPSEMPDYVATFGLGNSFYHLLDRVISGDRLDTAALEASVTTQLIDHFIKLTAYQVALRDALQLVARGKKSKIDRYLASKFGDSYHVQLDALEATAKQLPGWTASDKELDRADGLLVQVERMEDVFGRVEVDRHAAHTAEIEKEIFRLLPAIIERLWTQRDGARREAKLELGEVWKLLKPQLSTLSGPGDEATAKELVVYALDGANQHRLDNLQKRAIVALSKTDTLGAERTDTLGAERAANKAQQLARELGQPVTGQPDSDPMAKVKQLAAGESQNLVLIFTMAEAALSATAGNWGDVMRAANILKIAMGRGAATLTSALEVFPDDIAQAGLAKDIAAAVKATGGMGPVAQVFFDGTSQELFHGIQTSTWGVRGSVHNAFEVLRRSKSGGALQVLLKVEAAGGGLARRAALAELADRLDDKKGAQAYATAKFIYAFCLDALQLLDTSVAEQTDKAQGKTPTKADLAKRRDDARHDLDAGIHPVTKQGLLPQQQIWWSKYKKISGDDNIILPGKQGWAEIGDFVKHLVTMLAMAWISGGLATGVAELAGLGELGTGLVSIGLFTEGMRFAEEIQSGAVPEHGFAHDFFVNVVMAAASEIVNIGFGTLFKSAKTVAGKLAFKAGEFAAEYAATSAVSLIDLAYTQGIANVTAEDVKGALKSNFAFLAAFKGAAVLGAGATAVVNKQFGSKSDAASHALITNLKAIDREIAQQMERTAKAEDSRAQIDAVEQQVGLTEKKAKLLEDSNLPGAQRLAAQYRHAIDLFHADVARAKMMTSVGVKPIEGTPDFTYEGGPGAEARIAEHFARAGAQLKIEEGASGKVFEVWIGGGKVRFTPADALHDGAGSAGEAYTRKGRIESDTLKTPGDVMTVLHGSPATHASIPKGAKPQFLLQHGGAAQAKVTIKPVDHHSIKSPHALGPAAMKIEYQGADTFAVTIEVRRNTSNDQVVRSVNHEIVELTRFLDRAEEVGTKSGKGLDLFQQQSKLTALLKEEAAAAATKKGGKRGPPSSHDLGVIEGDVHTLGLQLEEILRKLNDSTTSKAQRAELQQRLDLLKSDMRKVWKMLDLPDGKRALDQRLEVFEQAGIHLSKEAVSQLQVMRANDGEVSGAAPRITPVEIQICFRELQKANPNLLKTATYLDLMTYYEAAIRTKAEEAVQAEYKRTGDENMALAAGMAVVREMAGGTSVESWRGRAFEGLSIDEWNRSPARLADRGRMYQVELNNFLTYDAVCVKGVDGVTITTTNGLLKIVDGHGTTVYEEYGGKKQPYLKPGVKVWKVSMKAKDAIDVSEMQSAIGTPKKPAGHGMLVTPEYMQRLKDRIARAKQGLADAKGGYKKGTRTQREVDQAQKQVTLLEFFRDRIEVSKRWSNAKIDAMIESLKLEGIDVEALEDHVVNSVP